MKQVVVLGSLNMDLVINVTEMPKKGETVLGLGMDRVPGGKGANQAYAIGKLGGKVAMIGAVGQDENGRILKKNLDSVGVNIDCVMELPDVPTGNAVIAVDQEAENSMETPDMAPGDITKRADAVMNQAYNITTGHLGINMENREQAVTLADTLSALFGKPWRETGKSFLVGDLVEVMKMIYLGEKGHMGILTDDLRRSIRFYQTKGAAFNMATYEENAIVYFAREYGGVAFHLTQRPKERGNEVL